MPFIKKSIFFISEGDQQEFRQLVSASTDDLFRHAMDFPKNKKVTEEDVSEIILSAGNRHRLTEKQIHKNWLRSWVKIGCKIHVRSNLLMKYISINSFFNFPDTKNPDIYLQHKYPVLRIYQAIKQPGCIFAF